MAKSERHSYQINMVQQASKQEDRSWHVMCVEGNILQANANGDLEQQGFRGSRPVSGRAFVSAVGGVERSRSLRSSVSVASVGSAVVSCLAYSARSEKFQVFGRSNAVVGSGASEIVGSRSYRASRPRGLSAGSRSVRIASVLSVQEGAQEMEAGHRFAQVKPGASGLVLQV